MGSFHARQKNVVANSVGLDATSLINEVCSDTDEIALIHMMWHLLIQRT